MDFIAERKSVVDAAREISSSGMVIGTWGNVSARVKGRPLMIITPSGMDYSTLTIEDMVLVEWEKNVAEGQYKPSVETPLHQEIYKQRPDVNAIVHVHSPFAAAFAVSGMAIPVVLEETAQVIGHPVQVAPYAHCGSKELAENTVKVLGSDRKAVLLANHGLVGVGENMASALKVCYIAEKTAMTSIYARLLGPVQPLSPEDINTLNQSFKYYGQSKQ
jgi:L-fuculose-phosphate aldolase